MKIAELRDFDDNRAPLYKASKLIIFDGKKEEISLAYGRISNLENVQYLFSKNLLDGEKNYLKIIADFIIDGEKFVRNEKSSYLECNDAELCIANSEISSGSIFNSDIVFFYPLPFRDSSIAKAILFDILDYDLIRELHRIIKRNGKMIVMIKDAQNGGVSMNEALKFIIKFKIDRISWNNGHWIIDARKILK